MNQDITTIPPQFNQHPTPYAVWLRRRYCLTDAIARIIAGILLPDREQADFTNSNNSTNTRHPSRTTGALCAKN